MKNESFLYKILIICFVLGSILVTRISQAKIRGQGDGREGFQRYLSVL